jgi:hypothetical protein
LLSRVFQHVIVSGAFRRRAREAFRGSWRNLSNGVSQAITAAAYIVPRLFVVMLGLYLVLFLWRRGGG